MMKYILICLLIAIIGFSCNTNETPEMNAKKEAEAAIHEAEKEFARMAKEEGVAAAFLQFAAEDAVLNRNNKLVKGKSEIKAYFGASPLQDVSLEWSPDKVVASSSGDLGYTYGKYTFAARDSSGKQINSEGIFHTVWQKQEDGSWKFVWD